MCFRCGLQSMRHSTRACGCVALAQEFAALGHRLVIGTCLNEQNRCISWITSNWVYRESLQSMYAFFPKSAKHAVGSPTSVSITLNKIDIFLVLLDQSNIFYLYPTFWNRQIYSSSQRHQPTVVKTDKDVI